MNQLFIVGCGIKFLSHMTLEVQSVIQQSDCVIYLLNDPAMKKWITDNSIYAISLDPIYFGSKERKDVYNAICHEIINVSLQYKFACFVTYGHPLFLSNSPIQLVKAIEKQSLNIKVVILPGISSLDSLLCDLQIDPGVSGIQGYEATEFMQKNYKINTDNHLFLWQIGVAGIKNIINNDKELIDNNERIIFLSKIKQKLLCFYDLDHPIILYVASMYPSIPFEKVDISLKQLNSINIPRLATAYIQPK